MKKKRAPGQPEKIKEVLWNVLRGKGYEKSVREQQIVEAWGEIVGEKVAGQTEASAVENGRLMVRVSNAAWRNELVYLKPEILKKINEFAGKDLIKDVIFLGKG